MAHTATRYAYLHGFASGPRSRKGLALAPAFEAAGAPLERPDLNAPSFARLTYTAALGAIDAVAGEAGRWGFVGSSLGGYLAARWAELHPERVERLVLLCPGFDLVARWPKLVGPAAMTRWMAHGVLTVPDGAGVPTPLHWGFIEDAMTHPRVPEVACPTLIIHGTRDETVPIESSRTYAAARDHVALVEVDDDHTLAASLPQIAAAALAFFGLGDAEIP